MRALVLCFCLLVTASQPASGHHAVAMIYQPEEMISVTGTVEAFRFYHPHCVIYLTRTNVEGESERGTIERAGASALWRQGGARTLSNRGMSSPPLVSLPVTVRRISHCVSLNLPMAGRPSIRRIAAVPTSRTMS